METFCYNPDTRELPMLIRGEEAARIADEFTVAPRLLNELVDDINTAYRNGFKETDGMFYIRGNDHHVDEAVKYAEKFLTERNYLCDIRKVKDKIYYTIKWPAVPDSQQNQ